MNAHCSFSSPNSLLHVRPIKQSQLIFNLIYYIWRVFFFVKVIQRVNFDNKTTIKVSEPCVCSWTEHTFYYQITYIHIYHTNKHTSPYPSFHYSSIFLLSICPLNSLSPVSHKQRKWHTDNTPEFRVRDWEGSINVWK